MKWEDAYSLEQIPVSAERVVCSYFGCGKQLTRYEQLYGNTCVHHSGEIMQTVGNHNKVNIVNMNTDTTNYQEQAEHFRLKYEQLKNKTKNLLDMQRAYFKSNKDPQLFRKCKAIEQEVDELISDRKAAQAKLNWLGQ